jgi:hypothetical protein
MKDPFMILSEIQEDSIIGQESPYLAENPK